MNSFLNKNFINFEVVLVIICMLSVLEFYLGKHLINMFIQIISGLENIMSHSMIYLHPGIQLILQPITKDKGQPHSDINLLLRHSKQLCAQQK